MPLLGDVTSPSTAVPYGSMTSELREQPVRVAQGVEAWPDSARLVQRIAGSNPASGMDVCVRLCVF